MDLAQARARAAVEAASEGRSWSANQSDIRLARSATLTVERAERDIYDRRYAGEMRFGASRNDGDMYVEACRI